MDPASKTTTAPGDAKYINFPRLPDDATRDGKPVLNKYSTFITKEHDFPGAQVRSLSLPLYPLRTANM